MIKTDFLLCFVFTTLYFCVFNTSFDTTVPSSIIFDGFQAITADMKDWIAEKFPGLIDDLDNVVDSSEDFFEAGVNAIEVQVGCSKWWYCADDKFALQGTDQMPILPPTEISDETSEISMCSEILDFYMVPIIKRNNRRKHNRYFDWCFLIFIIEVI